MKILGIDPGTRQSAFVVWATKKQKILDKGIIPNESMIKLVRAFKGNIITIEMIASYGMPVGKEVFETVLWIGRFLEAYALIMPNVSKHLVYRREIKMFFCNSMKANDSSIRQAIIDYFGGDKQKVIGLKQNPGRLYGVKKDIWAALAVVLYTENKYKLPPFLNLLHQ